ncbi:hypothetical protein [Chryseolinea sp. H1M3-3]|uniref:hypothetical protein n=1 Tax=Chryseolinea sp. H1M3-3 TaxID=3034144 RepID=UPI0023ED062F|nr:hypothetical protein [Chryseolinea sp. H1M3-3]
MRIYLDSCVYQDFKRNGGEELLALTLNSKNDNIYCYSEAHIYDLVRDKSDEKFRDMELIEKVADKNCYHYDKKIEFNYYSPTQYYNRFEWDSSVDIFGDVFTRSLLDFLKFIPIDFKQYIKLDQIPADCPPDFISLLEQPSNLYDFCMSFLNFSEELSEDKKKFKDFVRYLHGNSLTGKIYEGLGIKGFDGQTITNKTDFKDTYLDFQAKQSVDKSMNSVFANMYNGLEMFGIVKGKPRKQQMMNMVNDGKHAYFGTFCDMVVSSDEDFIKKTKFLYDIFDIGTKVLSTDEFLLYLKYSVPRNTVEECIKIINQVEWNKMQRTVYNNEDCLVSTLQPRFYGYFNRLIFLPGEESDNFYFLRESVNWSTGTLAKEIEYVTNLLSRELGPDSNGNELFDGSEFESENWKGRAWIKSTSFIVLKYREGLTLRFGFVHEHVECNGQDNENSNSN